MLCQSLPGTADGNRCAQYGRCIKVQILDLGVHVIDTLGSLETKAVQNDLGLVGYAAQTSGFIFPIAYGIAQSGISHSGDDGVGIGVAVTGNINRIHNHKPPKYKITGAFYANHTISIYYYNEQSLK